jgi:hypothetical protein
MILATRIPQLTEKMLAATRRAAVEQQASVHEVAPAPDSSREYRLVRGLEALGYTVRIEKRVA